MAVEFFKSLAKSQVAPLPHNNLLCFVDGEPRTYALQAGCMMEADDYVETVFAARLGEDFPIAAQLGFQRAQGAENKLCWYSNAPPLPHAVAIREQQLRFGKHTFTLPRWFHSFAFFETLAAEASVPLDQLRVQVIEWSWENKGLVATKLACREFKEMAWPTDAPEPSRRKAPPPPNKDTTVAFYRSMGMHVKARGSDSIVSAPLSRQKLAEMCPSPEEVESDSESGDTTER